MFAAAALFFALAGSASAWTVAVIEPGAFRVERSAVDTDAPVVRIWYRSTAPATNSWAAGSFDTTGAGNQFTTQIATLTLDVSDRVVEYRTNYTQAGNWFLVDVGGENVIVQCPAMASVAVSQSVPISVVGTLPVSLATSASIDGTLPVTVQSLPPAYDTLGMFAAAALGLSLAGFAVRT